jgi:hypothetical protein
MKNTQLSYMNKGMYIKLFTHREGISCHGTGIKSHIQLLYRKTGTKIKLSDLSAERNISSVQDCREECTVQQWYRNAEMNIQLIQLLSRNSGRSIQPWCRDSGRSIHLLDRDFRSCLRAW